MGQHCTLSFSVQNFARFRREFFLETHSDSNTCISVHLFKIIMISNIFISSWWTHLVKRNWCKIAAVRLFFPHLKVLRVPASAQYSCRNLMYGQDSCYTVTGACIWADSRIKCSSASDIITCPAAVSRAFIRIYTYPFSRESSVATFIFQL